MGEKGEGSGGEGGGKWGERGRELGMGYPPVHPLFNASTYNTEWFNSVFVQNDCAIMQITASHQK